MKKLSIILTVLGTIGFIGTLIALFVTSSKEYDGYGNSFDFNQWILLGLVISIFVFGIGIYLISKKK